MLEEVIVYGYVMITNGSDAKIKWFLTLDKLNQFSDEVEEGFHGDYVGTDDYQILETFIGSNIHKKAVQNEKTN